MTEDDLYEERIRKGVAHLYGAHGEHVRFLLSRLDKLRAPPRGVYPRNVVRSRNAESPPVTVDNTISYITATSDIDAPSSSPSRDCDTSSSHSHSSHSSDSGGGSCGGGGTD